MKYLFFILSGLVVAVTHAQDSCRITKEVDQFTNKKRYSAPFSIFGSSYSETFATATRNGKSLMLYFSIKSKGDPNCFKEGSKSVVLFEDGSKIELFNDSDLNCEGTFTVSTVIMNGTLILMESEFKQLSEKPIKAIRFYTMDGYLDVECGSNDHGMSNVSQNFQKDIACLIEASE